MEKAKQEIKLIQTTNRFGDSFNRIKVLLPLVKGGILIFIWR